MPASIPFSSSLSSGLIGGRRILVTGAAGGIGVGICEALERNGAVAVRSDKRPSEGHLGLDVTDEDSVARGFASAGDITDVIHSAGHLAVGPIADTSADEFRATMDSNLMGAFLVGREAARRLPGGGSLTFISSQAGFRAGANWGAYCAVKAGVLRLAEALAQELGPRGIRVNSVCPGTVGTRMLDDVCARISALSGEDPDAVRKRYEAASPLGRSAKVSEIGDVCVFLASRLASYVSGVSFPVDGGEVSA